MRHRRAGVLRRDRTGQHEDPGADHRAQSHGGERDRAEHPVEARRGFDLLVDGGDGLAGGELLEDGQGAPDAFVFCEVLWRQAGSGAAAGHSLAQLVPRRSLRVVAASLPSYSGTDRRRRAV